ncbi:MAG: ATP-binding cassette domain-containing protein [Rhodothermales bacterium]|nr:ATP-binding cassette domain-containing protein [Rhodothermales bacterium]MBO6778780.1 ATP-binding cassette domain-containing protein [Rhodothermales bacterium]
MIEVQGLTKRYGPERAVDDISFQVQSGEVLGFLGPNGAGKTTTMKVITCYLPPTEGTVRVSGRDVRSEPLEVRRQIGYLPEHTPLYLDMRVFDYLDFVAAMRGIEANRRPGRIADMAEVCGLAEVLQKRIETLSKGFRQRVGLAQAMIHDPEILILDEPTTGLDPNQIVEIRELIRAIGREKTVILSTHILSEVQASCDRVLIIHRGRLVADGTPTDLQDSFTGGQRVQLAVHTGDGVLDALSAGDFRVTEQSTDPAGQTLYTVTSDRKDDIRPDLFRMAVEKGWVLSELHRDQANLEDVFRQLTAA